MNRELPKRGEIWRIDFRDALGSEPNKIRPGIVVNSDDTGVLPVRLVVPLTTRQPQHESYEWIVEVPPTYTNGLTQISSADPMLMSSASLRRFKEQIGTLGPAILAAIEDALTFVLDLP